MLAPLGFYLVIILIACTTILLLCWVYDTARAEVEARRSRPADSKFVFDSTPFAGTRASSAASSRIRFEAATPTRGRRRLRKSLPPAVSS
jgi:hypothetical protein